MRRLLLASLVAVACSRGEIPPATATPPGGTLIIATGADADQVLPPLVATSVGKQVSDALFLPIARVGDELNMLGDEGFTGVLANTWEWSADSLSIRFTLDPAARWHDGRPVRAEDVAFTFDLYRAPGIAADLASKLAGIRDVTVDDSLRFTVHWTQRNATQFYDFAHHVIPVPKHTLASIGAADMRSHPAAREPVGSGKFRLARWVPGERLEVMADAGHWLGRPSLDRVIWTVVPDPNAQLAQLLAGEADLVEALRGPAVQQAAADSNLALLTRPAVDYVVAQFNLRARRDRSRPHPLLADVRVRQALTFALDRPTLVRAVLDTLGVAMPGPYLTIADVRGTTFPPQDVERARALLTEAGFADADGDGILERAGQRLAFTVSAPTSSSGRLHMQTLLIDAWKAVGASVTAEKMDNPAMMARNEAADFDVSLLGFTGSAAPSDVRPQWATAAVNQGTNWGAWSDAAFDAHLDTASTTTNPRIAREQYAAAGQRLVDNPPAIWLYEARLVTGMHRRIRPAAIRADAWWAHLDEWSIDPERMLDRDRMGLGATPRP